MKNITFDLPSLHLYGSAFFDYLRLRKSLFIDALHWDVPHDQRYEMDQYDNPTAWYSLVLRGSEVIGGARVMPTTARWGTHTYMLRDAYQRKFDGIPFDAIPAEIVTDQIWESTRLVVADTVRTKEERSACLSMIVDGVSEIAMRHGASELMTVSPVPLIRTLRQLGFPAQRFGDPYRDESDGRRYAVLRMDLAAPVQAIAAQ